jgi:hypothetical protein
MEGGTALAAGALGGMMFVAGVAKLRKHDDFLSVVASYRLLPAFMLESFAWGLALCEMVAGILLLSGVGRVGGGLLSAGLFAVFSLAMGVNVARGRTSLSCGCMPGLAGEALSWGLGRAYGAPLCRWRSWRLVCRVLHLGSGLEGISLPVWGAGCAAGLAVWVIWLALGSLPQNEGLEA